MENAKSCSYVAAESADYMRRNLLFPQIDCCAIREVHYGLHTNVTVYTTSCKLPLSANRGLLEHHSLLHHMPNQHLNSQVEKTCNEEHPLSGGLKFLSSDAYFYIWNISAVNVKERGIISNFIEAVVRRSYTLCDMSSYI